MNIIEGRTDARSTVESSVIIHPSDVTAMCADPTNHGRTIVAEQSRKTGETILYCIPVSITEAKRMVCGKED